MLPPWPGWAGLHPLIIHFPIALLLVTPLFVLAAVLRPRDAPRYAMPALVLLVLGTAATFVAVESGEAAAELATRTEAIDAVLARHSGLAETTSTIFAILTVLYAAMLIVPLRVKALARPIYTAGMNALFLALLLGANLLLANVAHQGGTLVHRFGVQAVMPAVSSAENETGAH